ncbi:Prefoldin [Apiospora arundinis]
MSISNEALQKLVREIESQSMVAQQQIALVRTQQASKQREARMAQLTQSEIASLPKDTGVYEGVGKMFVALPVSSLNEKLEGQIKEAQKEVEGLGKKLTSLEITQKNSKEHIDRMLRGARRRPHEMVHPSNSKSNAFSAFLST